MQRAPSRQTGELRNNLHRVRRTSGHTSPASGVACFTRLSLLGLSRAKTYRSRQCEYLWALICGQAVNIDCEARVLLNARLPSGRRVVSLGALQCSSSNGSSEILPTPLFSGRTRANLEAPEPPAQLGYGAMSSHRLGQTPRGQSSAGRSLCRRLWISQVVVTNPGLLGSRGFDRRLAGRASPIHRGLFLSGAGAPAEMPAETGSWLLWSGFAPLQIQVNRPS